MIWKIKSGERTVTETINHKIKKGARMSTLSVLTTVSDYHAASVFVSNVLIYGAL